MNDRISIGRIPLKQVRVSRADREKETSTVNPMNKLVPYLDLFCRLDDDELARLAGVEKDVCTSLRTQVDAINHGLAAYTDLLPRLSDDELVRLTGASDRTIRFWRLCQPRGGIAPKLQSAAQAVQAASSEANSGVPEKREPVPTAPHSVVTDAPSESDTTGKFKSTAGAGESSAAEDAAGYVKLSGAPFPGFDDDSEEIAEVTLEEVEGEPDPLGLNNA